MKLKDTLPTAFTALLACVLLCPAARAEESACKADIEKFCKDVQPSEGRIVKCLREHEAELSAECKTKGEELKDRTEGFKEACQADLDKFCKDIKQGEGRLAKCLKEHQAEVSGPCKAKIAEVKEERQEKIKGGRMGKMKDKRGETLRGRMKKKGMKGAGAQPADEN